MIHAAVRPSLSHHRSAEAGARTPSPSHAEAAARTPNFSEAAVWTLDGTDDEDLSDDSSDDNNEILGYKEEGGYPAPITRFQ
jgi:hypothetical protein